MDNVTGMKLHNDRLYVTGAFSKTVDFNPDPAVQYSLTAAGKKRLAQEAREWRRTADLIAAFLSPREEAP